MLINLERESDGRIEKVELPLAVLVIGDFRGAPKDPSPELLDRKLVEIDRENFERVLSRYTPRVAFRIPDPVSRDGTSLAIDLEFESLADFQPSAVASRLDCTRSSLERRAALADVRDRIQSKPEIEVALAAYVEQSRSQSLGHTERRAPDPLPAQSATEPFDAGLEQIMKHFPGDREWTAALLNVVADVAKGKDVHESHAVLAVIETNLEELDLQLSRRLDAILHHPSFQRLEAVWLGLYRLVSAVGSDRSIILRCMHATFRDLQTDARRAVRFDRSASFLKIVAEENILGGVLYSLIVLDHAFSRLPEELHVLEHLAAIAAADHAVLLAGLAPQMFGVRSFVELLRPPDLRKLLDMREYARWKEFRHSELSQHVVLVMPRVLGRAPYLLSDADGHTWNYEEQIGGEHHNYVWVNAAFVMAERIAISFLQTGWFASISGVSEGGVIDELPTFPFATTTGPVIPYCAVEIPISERAAGELAEMGFTPLIHCAGTDYAAFFVARSMHQTRSAGDSSIALSRPDDARLIMITNRFTQVIRTLLRDRPTDQRFNSKDDLEGFANAWLQRYVRDDPEMSPAIQAQYPLREATVQISRVRTYPTIYKIRMELLLAYPLNSDSIRTATSFTVDDQFHPCNVD